MGRARKYDVTPGAIYVGKKQHRRVVATFQHAERGTRIVYSVGGDATRECGYLQFRRWATGGCAQGLAGEGAAASAAPGGCAVRVDASVDANAFRFRFVDARTGLRLAVNAVWADDATHEVGIASLARFLEDGVVEVVAVQVPRVVIDLERDTILIYAGDPMPEPATERRDQVAV